MSHPPKVGSMLLNYTGKTVYLAKNKRRPFNNVMEDFIQIPPLGKAYIEWHESLETNTSEFRTISAMLKGVPAVMQKRTCYIVTKDVLKTFGPTRHDLLCPVQILVEDEKTIKCKDLARLFASY